MELNLEDALYNAADSTRKTPAYGNETNNSTPSSIQIAKFRTQLIRFLEAVPEETTVLELLEELYTRKD